MTKQSLPDLTLNRSIIEDYLIQNKPLVNIKSLDLYSRYSRYHPISAPYQKQFWLVFDKDGYITEEQAIKKERVFKAPLAYLPRAITEISFNDKNNTDLYSLLSILVYDDFLVLQRFTPTKVSFDDDRKSWILEFDKSVQHLLYFDSLDIVFKNGNHYQPVRLGKGGIGDTYLPESPFKGLPLFYMVEDFERAKQTDFPTTLTYGDLLRAQRDGLTRKELLCQHLKKASTLEGLINFNKFTVVESYLLTKMVTEFEPKTFINFVNWYREKGRGITVSSNLPYNFMTYRLELMIQFILDHINEKKDEFDEFPADSYITAKDFIRWSRSRRRKIKVDFTTLNGLTERHDKLYASIQNKMLKKENRNKPFIIYPEYQPLLKAVKKRNNKFKYLSKPIDLLKEGNRMGHCVGSYIDFVEAGECIILTVDLDKVHYTLEVEPVWRQNDVIGYRLVQMQSKFNGGVKKSAHENYVLTFLNTINVFEDKIF